ncbi:hypothetical protein [Bradyrhizobium sp.]|jgi:hypothetical protein|uniref:hypothetical protein n=1 Tax=Bradyrhizobium sp. TaxID=376 RepID=UPI002E03E755|nr:hypothetical protein [Bradyrhizobium sp.]
MGGSPGAVGAHTELQRVLKFSPAEWDNYSPPPDLSKEGLESLAEFGTPIVGSFVGKERLDHVRRWIAGVQELAEPRAVFMDTTTIAAVDSLVFDDDRSKLAPSTLLDLANFVSAIVLHDQIFHLKSPHLSSLRLNESIGGSPALVEIPVAIMDVDGEGGLLTAFWYQACDEINEIRRSELPDPKREEGNDISALWGELFGTAGKLNVFDPDIRDDYDSRGPGLVSKLVQYGDRTLDMPSRRELNQEELFTQRSRLASECNHRFLFNKLFSKAIRLPYQPNTFRVPFQKWLYDRSRTVEKGLSLAPFLDDQYREMIAKRIDMGATEMTLPFFLTALLRRISKREEFGEELASMRRRAYPLRKKLADLESAIKNGDLSEIDPLRKAIRGEAVRLTEWLQPAAISAAAAAVMTGAASDLSGGLLTAVLVLTYAAQYSGSAVSKLQERLVRPERWFIQKTAESATALTKAHGKLASLWGLPEAHALTLVQRLNVLAQSQRL